MKWSLGGFCLQGPGKQLVFYLDQRTLQNILRSPSECWTLISTSSPGLFSPNGRHFNGPMRRWWLPVTIQKMKKEDKGYLFLTVILLKPWKSVQGQRGLCFFSTTKKIIEHLQDQNMFQLFQLQYRQFYCFPWPLIQALLDNRVC